MARKADRGRAPPGTAPDPAKGVLSLALRRWRRIVLMALMALLAGAASARFATAESLRPAAILSNVWEIAQMPAQVARLRSGYSKIIWKQPNSAGYGLPAGTFR